MTADPLLYNTSLPYRRTFYPFGFPVQVSSNNENVIAAAASIWDRFSERRKAPFVELRLAVSDSDATERPAPRTPRGQGHLISFIHDADNFIVCDLNSGFASGWLTPVVAADPTYIRYFFVEGCVYLMIEALHLTPVHAACLSLDGRGVLLAGNSGAGKSTLAYACANQGWAYTCDDAAQIIRDSDGFGIVGNPYQIRLRPHAATLFPELAPHVPHERPNGKPSLELDTAPMHFDLSEQTRAECLVFLNRSPGIPQRLTVYDRHEAFTRLSQVICFGDQALRDRMTTSIGRLLQLPIYEMYYQDLDWAEQRLRALVKNNE